MSKKTEGTDSEGWNDGRIAKNETEKAAREETLHHS